LAYTALLLKKIHLDPAGVTSSQPISNLPMLSKLVESLVAQQMLEYLVKLGLLPDAQSAYRAYHSTETAVLKVQSGILRAVDGGDLVVLAQLDLSAAIDTGDHDDLLNRLNVSFGFWRYGSHNGSGHISPVRGSSVVWSIQLKFNVGVCGDLRALYLGRCSSFSSQLMSCGSLKGRVYIQLSMLMTNRSSGIQSRRRFMTECKGKDDV